MKQIAGIPMSEADLLECIIGHRGLAPLLGWLTMHQRPARTARTFVNKAGKEQQIWVTAIIGDPGFPDLVMAKAPRLILAELKAEGKMPEPDQLAWLDATAGVEVVETYLFWPSDWQSGEIEQVLTLGHVPNLIERKEFRSSWQNRRLITVNEI